MHFESVESEHYRALEKACITRHIVVGAVHRLVGQIDDVGAGGCELHEQVENQSKIRSPRSGAQARLMNRLSSENLQM